MKTLFGGSSSSSKSGYSALPKELRKQFDPFATAINQYTNPNNPGVTDAFTPSGPSAAENTAIGNINAGFAPTADSIKSDMAMQMNPFNDSVIGQINNQGNGQYSILKQALQEAGQSGSNRQALGANDIDLTRMNTIGGFLQNQFNTSMNNALTTLPGMRASDASSQMGVGDYLRQLQLQQNLAPVSAIQAGTGMMAPFVSGGSSSGSSQGGIIPGLSNMAASAITKSDRRLKENIEPVGMEYGHKVYEFNYAGSDKRYVGVMAQDVKRVRPDAVVTGPDGFLGVDYGKIGVEFREAV